MVFSPVDSIVLVPNLVMVKEDPCLCRDLGLKYSEDDSPGKLSLSFCTTVSIKSHQNLACSSGRRFSARSLEVDTIDPCKSNLQIVRGDVGVMVFSPADQLVPMSNPRVMKVLVGDKAVVSQSGDETSP